MQEKSTLEFSTQISCSAVTTPPSHKHGGKPLNKFIKCNLQSENKPNLKSKLYLGSSHCVPHLGAGGSQLLGITTPRQGTPFHQRPAQDTCRLDLGGCSLLLPPRAQRVAPAGTPNPTRRCSEESRVAHR